MPKGSAATPSAARVSRPGLAVTSARRGLFEPLQILAEQGVVGLELQARLKRGDRTGPVSLQVGHVGAILADERQLGRDALGFVELAIRFRVVAAASRTGGLIRESRRLALGIVARLLRQRRAEA